MEVAEAFLNRQDKLGSLAEFDSRVGKKNENRVGSLKSGTTRPNQNSPCQFFFFLNTVIISREDQLTKELLSGPAPRTSDLAGLPGFLQCTLKKDQEFSRSPDMFQ